MGELLLYVDRSTIRDGRLDDLRSGMTDLAAFVEENEPDILAYDVYFDSDRREMTVVHLHTGPETLAFHMEVAGPEFQTVADDMDIQSIDVYGDPGPDIVAQLEEKASTLGTGTVRVHDWFAGFQRLAAD